MQCTDLVYCLLPRPRPKCQACTTLLVNHDHVANQKLALHLTDPSREKVLFLFKEMTANLSHDWTPLHSPRHLPVAYLEKACQGCRQGLLFWALKKCLLNGYLIVYTFSLPYYRSTFTRSPVSVSSLLETFFGSCPGLLGVGEQGGALGGPVRSPSHQGRLQVHL